MCKYIEQKCKPYLDLDSRILEVKAFIKNESYPEYKYPRTILARSDEFKIRVGPFFKFCEEIMYNMKAPYGINYFIKKIPIPERARLIIDVILRGPGFVDRPTEFLRRYFSTDYTSFESSFKNHVMNSIEFNFYDAILKFYFGNHNFRKWVRKILGKNKISARYLKAFLKARRMSGEMNTSLGNGFSNLMIFLYLCYKYECQDVRCFVEGDDCIGTYIGPQFTVEDYASFGFIIKLKYLHYPNTASFCGQIFSLTNFIVITDPLKVLINFTWVNMKYDNCKIKVRYGLIRSKALSLIYQYPGCPIIQPFALRMLYLTKDYKPVIDTSISRYKQEIIKLAIDANLPVVPIEEASRQLMYEVFNLTLIEQQLFEQSVVSYNINESLDLSMFHITNLVWQENYFNYVV